LCGNLEEIKDAGNKSKRRHLNVDENELTNFLESLHSQKYPKSEKKPTKMFRPVFMVNHRLEARMYVVWLRYGSLN